MLLDAARVVVIFVERIGYANGGAVVSVAPPSEPWMVRVLYRRPPASEFQRGRALGGGVGAGDIGPSLMRSGLVPCRVH